ncbi:MAG: hypothetical protein WBQ71_15830 [Trebonia sp.]
MNSPARAKITRSTGLAAMYRPPARIASPTCSRGSASAARVECQVMSTASTAANEAALTRKTVPELVAASSARADGPGQVLVHRAQRDGLDSFGRADQLRLQSLPGRGGQRLPGADREHQREQDPGRDQPGDGQRAEGGGRYQHERLRGQQEAAAVHQVADRPGHDREQHDRQARRGLD